MNPRMPTSNDLIALEVAVLDNPSSPWFDPKTGETITKAVSVLCAIAALPLMIDRWTYANDEGASMLESILYSTTVATVTALVWWAVLLLVMKHPRWNQLRYSPRQYLLEQWAFAAGLVTGFVLVGTELGSLHIAILLGAVFNSIARLHWKPKLGLVTVLAIFYAIRGMSWFILVDAEWGVIMANRGTLFIGITLNSGVVNPNVQNESWRLWPSVVLITSIVCAAFGTTSVRRRHFLVGYLLFLVTCLVFVWHPLERNYDPDRTLARLSIVGLWGVACYLSSSKFSGSVEDYLVNRLRSYLVAASVFVFFLTVALLDPPDAIVDSGLAEKGLDPSQWGGLYVNLILISAALVMGFAFAVLLAFGRRSEQPFYSWPSTLIIEFVRSGPMVAWLFIALFILPDITRPFYDIDVVTSSILAFTIFGACYIAEVLRGGLQDVRTGQLEAAVALGLSPTQVKLSVELPSAVRTTLPAIVSIFIGLWKDTTLLYLLGVLDFFFISKILPNTEFRFGDDYLEPLLFSATLFWLFAFVLSRISLKVEEGLGLVKEGGGELT